jgi:ABC-type multidrug transport system ATPase subunit
MRKRLAIVRALLFDPVLLLLDEPTSSLDPIGIAAMRDAMATARKRYGTTVVFSSHDLARLKSLQREPERFVMAALSPR